MPQRPRWGILVATFESTIRDLKWTAREKSSFVGVLTVHSNTINGSDESGIHVDSTCGPVTNNVISGNTINDCAAILGLRAQPKRSEPPSSRNQSVQLPMSGLLGRQDDFSSPVAFDQPNEHGFEF